MRRQVLACALASLAIAGALSGCTSTSTPSSTSTASPTSTAAPGLRGYPASSLTCPARLPTGTPGSPQPITGEVRTYVVCPLLLGNGGQPTEGPVVVTPADGTVFTALDHALRSPDIPPVPGAACPAMGQIPRVILVRTSDGDWSAHLPTDSCGFYQAALLSAVLQAQPQVSP